MLPGQLEFVLKFPRGKRPPKPAEDPKKKKAAEKQRKAADKFVAKKRAELRAARKSREENART